jgi:hypothetical protein
MRPYTGRGRRDLRHVDGCVVCARSCADAGAGFAPALTEGRRRPRSRNALLRKPPSGRQTREVECQPGPLQGPRLLLELSAVTPLPCSPGPEPN